MTDNDFGSELMRLRESRGLSVNQLAMYSGVSASLISKIENGVRGVPKPDTIEKLAKGLKMDKNILMKKAGYIPGDESETPDAVDTLIKFLEMDLSDDEIIQRMTFRVGDLNLSEEEIRMFLAFVRSKRASKAHN